jgi:hypothetical protein
VPPATSLPSPCNWLQLASQNLFVVQVLPEGRFMFLQSIGDQCWVRDMLVKALLYHGRPHPLLSGWRCRTGCLLAIGQRLGAIICEYNAGAGGR